MSDRVYTLKPSPEGGRRPGFLDDLNAAQREAATAGDGPTLLIAGAGSGKTRTLVYRVAWLISRGVSPEQVLLLTFTNRAAKEMIRRAEGLLGGVAKRVVAGTFHSVAHRLLRPRALTLGYQPGYGIVDPDDARLIMRACVAEMGTSTKGRRFPKPQVLLRVLSKSINTGQDFADLFGRLHPNFAEVTEAARGVCARYAERKVELNVMDFDDLLINWLRLLDDPGLGEGVRRSFRHILVDEYQDTNRLQGELVDRMAEDHGCVTVVGDDCQAIYSFRGASFDNIMRFPERHPGTRTHRLEDNYRSTPQILALANRSIAHNARQFDKTLRPVRPGGGLPALVPCQDTLQQASFVATRVLELREEGTPLAEQAVLYRAHRHAAELEVELRRRDIPYVVRSGLRFFEQAHVKDALAWLKIVSNPADELSWRRVLLLQPSIGDVAAGRIVAARSQGTEPALRGRAAQSWERVLRLRDTISAAPPGEALQVVLDGGYADHLRQHNPNARERIEDVRALGAYAAAFEDLGAFLDEVSGITEVSGQGFRDRAPDGEEERLVLSTVHRAKGLEWGAVFVIGLSDGLFPLPWAVRNERELEEERRLFYVAATRAKTDLHLAYPVFGVGGLERALLQQESRFVQELRGQPHVYETWRVEEEGPR